MKSFVDLLIDKCFFVIVCYLWWFYCDFMINSMEWGLVKLGDSIVGVYSMLFEMLLK